MSAPASRYAPTESRAPPPCAPISHVSVVNRVCSERASTGAYTPTDSTPSAEAALAMRMAISPRLLIKTRFSNATFPADGTLNDRGFVVQPGRSGCSRAQISNPQVAFTRARGYIGNLEVAHGHGPHREEDPASRVARACVAGADGRERVRELVRNEDRRRVRCGRA